MIDPTGRTALHYAAEAFDEALVGELVKRSASVDPVDNDGFTPLTRALSDYAEADDCWSSGFLTLRALLDGGANALTLLPDGRSGLHCVAPVLRNFSKKDRKEQIKEDDGRDHFTEATTLYQQFLDAGCDRNSRDRNGETPIFHYVRAPKSYQGFSDLARSRPSHPDDWTTFIETHDIFPMNLAGDSLLHAIARRAECPPDSGEDEILLFKALVDSGLDPWKENNQCETALDIAAAQEKTDILDTSCFIPVPAVTDAPKIMLSHPTDSLLTSALLCLLPVVLFLVGRIAPRAWSQRRDLPVINPRDPWSLSTGSARLRFLLGGPGLIKQGLSKWKVFQVLTNDGPQVVLDPEFTKEIRNHNSLSLGAFMYQRFHAHLNAFRPYQAFFEKDEAFIKFIRKKLVPQEWHPVALKSSLGMIIARVLAKTFVGDPLCNNVRWLQIMVEYTVDSVQASEALRKWPTILRPIMIHALPVCRKLKAEMAEAESLIGSVLDQRRLEKEAALQSGQTPTQYMDAFEWMSQH
ncbi:unnamed protein product [Penicillium olsonii]|nr:unnamed protein product [Penicillium olsonii]